MSKIILSVTPWDNNNMKDYQWVEDCLLQNAYTEKIFQPAWQAYKYLLKDKMYAYVGIDDKNQRPIITVKLEPMFSDMLRNEYQDIIAGYYMNKIHWSTIYLDGTVPNDIIEDIIYTSYKLSFSSLSKKSQQELSENKQNHHNL